MTPRQLSYFLAIVEAGSVTGASRRLGLAQPALSQHLKALENDMGVSLVERHARGVRVTPAGERLVRHARALERQYERIAADVRMVDGATPSGRVHLGVAASLALVLVPEVARHLRERAPGVEIHLYSPISVRARRMLDLGELDIGLLPGVADARHLGSRPVYREALSFIGLREQLEPMPDPVPLAALAGLPLAAPPHDHDLRRHLESIATRSGTSLDVRYTIHDNSLVRPLLEAGLAFAILPRSALGRDWDGPLAARSLAGSGEGRILSIAWPMSRPVTRSVALVAELLAETIQELIGDGSLDGSLVDDGGAMPAPMA